MNPFDILIGIAIGISIESVAILIWLYIEFTRDTPGEYL